MSSKDATVVPYPEFPTPDTRVLQVQEFLRLWSAAYEGYQSDDPRIAELPFEFGGDGYCLYSATAAELGDYLGSVLKGEELHFELMYKSRYGATNHIWYHLWGCTVVAAFVGCCGSILLEEGSRYFAWIPFGIVIILLYFGRMALFQREEIDSNIPEFWIYRKWCDPSLLTFVFGCINLSAIFLLRYIYSSVIFFLEYINRRFSN